MNRESFGDKWWESMKRTRDELRSTSVDVTILCKEFKETQKEVSRLKEELAVVHDSLQCLRREILTEKKEKEMVKRIRFEDLQPGKIFKEERRLYVKLETDGTSPNAINIQTKDTIQFANFDVIIPVEGDLRDE